PRAPSVAPIGAATAVPTAIHVRTNARFVSEVERKDTHAMTGCWTRQRPLCAPISVVEALPPIGRKLTPISPARHGCNVGRSGTTGFGARVADSCPRGGSLRWQLCALILVVRPIVS